MRKSSSPKRSFHKDYPQYDTSNGFGTAKQTRAAFYHRMGFDEAERIKNAAGSAWRSEYKILSEAAVLDTDLNDTSMWSEIKSAFRKAAMNCHPDRATQHGMVVAVAEENFKQVNAAYAILAHKYGED